MGLFKFLKSLRTLAQNRNLTIEEAYKFAQQEFGEVSDLLKLQINKIFKDVEAPSIKKPSKPEGKVIEAQFKSGKTFDELLAEEKTPLMGRLETGIEKLKSMKKPGMDLAVGLTKTAARSILNKKGIEVPDKVDPTEIFIKEFGADVLGDVQNVAEEMIELQRMGKSTKSMDEILEQEGMFDIEPRPDAPRGYTDEEMEEIKKAIEQEDMLFRFDPEGREPNAVGGRVGYGAGGGVKTILKIIEEIKKLDPMDAMKEVNEVVAKRGKYKNLSDEDTQKIFDETNDHIFERDVKPKETDVNFEDEVDLPEGVDPRDTILPTKKILDDVDEDFDLEKGLDDLDNLNITKDAARAKKAIDDYDLAPKMTERFKLKQKYPGIDDKLLTQIIDDPDPQRKAEALAVIDQAFALMKQGKSPEEVLDIMKQRTDRTKQAGGGLAYLMGL